MKHTVSKITSLLMASAFAVLMQGHRVATGAAQQPAGSGRSAVEDADIQKRVNAVHALIWGNYIQRENGLLLTRLDMAGKPFYVAGLGQSPSLEDTSLDGGMYLDALVQRYAKTRKPGTASRARILFRGLIKNATVSPSRGLLARGTHPNGVTYWGEPSVDQYTGAIFGLWRYYRTLATPEEKGQVRAVFTAFLERLHGSNWTILDERGKPVIFGDLGTPLPTRAERLLAFLAATYDVTGDRRWLDLYNQEKKLRLAHCSNFVTYDGKVILRPEVQFQNALALRILLDAVKDEADLAVFREGARSAAAACVPFLDSYTKLVLPGGRFMNRAEMKQAGLWHFPVLSGAVRITYFAAETILLLEGREHYARALQACRPVTLGLDFTELRYSGWVFPAEYFYWLAVNRGLLAYDASLDVETRTDAPRGAIEAYRLLDEDVYGDGSRYGISLR